VSDFVDYLKLTATEREALHQWVRDHDCVPELTPLDGIRIDPDTGEALIRQYVKRSGRQHIGANGKPPETIVVRRQIKRELPWRTK